MAPPVLLVRALLTALLLLAFWCSVLILRGGIDAYRANGRAAAARPWRRRPPPPSNKNWEEWEDISFMAAREDVYLGRRRRIREVCKVLMEEERIPEKFSYEVPLGVAPALVHVRKKGHDVAYCQIPKVASSTWTRNLMVLGGERPFAENHLVAPRRFPPRMSPSDGTPIFDNVTTVSMAIVRHPLSRLVSAYHSKIIAMGFAQWDRVRRTINSKYKLPGTDKAYNEDTRVPLPDEFLRFVLDHRGDPHWRPQHEACPFCQVDFTIYSKMEELAEDTKYFAIKAGLTSKETADLGRSRINPTEGDPEDTARKFWSGVSESTLKNVLDVYSVDLDMFGYSADEYLEELGLRGKLEKELERR